MTSVPDYYKVLGVQPTASQQEIRDAYKKSALKTHPDRVSSTDPTRAARTRKFQEVNDAYYTLSDKQRRKDYDEARRYHTPPPKEAPPNQQWQDEQFGGIFEEMLREEGMAAPGEDEAGTGRFYGVLGGISGAALGFIVGNVPGALAGAVAGNRLGAVRDAKGKSVYDVFQQLPQGDKAKISPPRYFHTLLAHSGKPGKVDAAVVVFSVVLASMALHPDRRWVGKARRYLTG